MEPEKSFALGSWRWMPYAQAAWLRLHRPAVQESGGLAAVTLDAETDRRWLGKLGIRVERPWLTPHGEARMTLDLGGRRLWGGSNLSSSQAYRADPGQHFKAKGLPLPRHALSLDLGVQAPVARRTNAVLAYTGQHGGGQRQHGIWLGVSGSFR